MQYYTFLQYNSKTIEYIKNMYKLIFLNVFMYNII